MELRQAEKSGDLLIRALKKNSSDMFQIEIERA
jgi:hypothetical protein